MLLCTNFVKILLIIASSACLNTYGDTLRTICKYTQVDILSTPHPSPLTHLNSFHLDPLCPPDQIQNTSDSRLLQCFQLWDYNTFTQYLLHNAAKNIFYRPQVHTNELSCPSHLLTFLHPSCTTQASVASRHELAVSRTEELVTPSPHRVTAALTDSLPGLNYVLQK